MANEPRIHEDFVMKVGTFGGIGVYIHWTFWLLIALFRVTSATSAGGAAGIMAALFVMSIFACVLLHEFGHVAAAAAFGIKTSDITLLPIGGVARLTRMPDRPYQELLIALAGPAVNVVIAGILLVILAFGIVVGGSAPLMGSMDFLTQLLVANIVLVVFNLLPAFPMDGGRVLRSLLAMRTSHLRATEIAARVGRWMAFAFGVYALVSLNFGLLLVAGFIFFAGTAELWSVRMQHAATGFGGQQGGYPGAATYPGEKWRQVWPVYEDVARQPASDADHRSAGYRSTGDWERYTNSRRPPTSGDVVDAVEVKRL